MKKGFTLVELLAVLSVLAILTLIGTKTITNLVNKAKNDAYNSEVSTIKSSLKMYASDNLTEMPDEDDTMFLTLYQLKEYGYLKDIVNTKTKHSFADDSILSIENEDGNYAYGFIDGTQINDYETLPDLYFTGNALDVYNLNAIYTEDTVTAKSYTGTNITANVTKQVYSVIDNTDTLVENITTSTPGYFKIVYTVTDSNNTVSIIKNIKVLSN